MHLRRRSLFETVLGALGLSREAAGAAAGQTGGAGGTGGRREGALGGYILADKEMVVRREFDVVVVGGGIAGTCAAIAAARNGAKVGLVHERSMLGGNSSSEVRLYPEVSTNHNIWSKELGILEEFHTVERRANPEPYQEGLLNAQWDLVLYERAVGEKNLTLFLNTTVREVEMKDASTILAVHGYQMGSEKKFLLSAPLFIDSTGDGVLGYRAGADYRWGMEARAEFGEAVAPERASAQPQMGSSLFFRARDAGAPIEYAPPEWAAKFEAEADLRGRNHSRFETGYWWLEVGLPMHQIHDNEEIKHEALRQLLGVWDHIKNHCPNKEQARNYALDFVSFWLYKREARRLMGDYVLTQQDAQNPKVHADSLAFGCWFVDVHKPGGILARATPNTNPGWEEGGTIPYGIPLRSCYSRNIHNLMMAGRPISASYVAFSSTRVLRTGAIVGQGVGTAAALCKKHGCGPRELAARHARELQQTLLRQDCAVPGAVNEDASDLARGAVVTASSEAALEFPEGKEFVALDRPLAQLFPVTSRRLGWVELLLRSTRDEAVEVRLGLRRAEFVYDFRAEGDVAVSTAVVAPRSTGYVRFRFERAVEAERLYYVHVPRLEGLAWAIHSDERDGAAVSPAGCTAAEMPGATRWHALTNNRNFSVRVEPEQRPYGAGNVVRGSNRPDRWTNLWISDAARGLPAWLELRLPRARRMNRIEIFFDTDVNRHSRRALFVYPDCVKRYEVSVWAGGWRRVAGETENYLRRRVLAFDEVETDRVRIDVQETNGARSARVYEVRLYGEAGG